MSEAITALTRQMLEWLAVCPRNDREVMEAWCSNCPRLGVWEDAWSAGLLARDSDSGQVVLSETGRAPLERHAGR